MAYHDLTAARLRELFAYDPETGIFVRKVKTSPRARLGVPCGTKDTAGYLQIRVGGIYLLAHRLAWLYVYGSWPTQVIDHINGSRVDNRISNLRDVSQRVNAENQRIAARHNLRSKLLGAHFHAQSGKFLAHIRTRGVSRHLGVFDTEEQAHAAYVAEKRRIHEGCTI